MELNRQGRAISSYPAAKGKKCYAHKENSIKENSIKENSIKENSIKENSIKENSIASWPLSF